MTYRNNCLATINLELFLLVRDANTVHHKRKVVRSQPVPTPLREQTKSDDEQQSVPVPLCPNKVDVSACLFGVQFQVQGFSDLSKFELHSQVCLVTIGMILGQRGQCLCVAVFGDQPSWGLWDDPDGNENDESRESLENRGDTPRPVVLDGEGAERDPSCSNATDIPELVVYSRDPATVLRMGELGEQQGRRVRAHAVSETDEEATGNEHGEVL